MNIKLNEKLCSQLNTYYGPFCIDEGTERDGTYITLLPSLACCSVSLLTLELDAFPYNASFVYLTEEELLQLLFRFLLCKKDQIMN